MPWLGLIFSPSQLTVYNSKFYCMLSYMLSYAFMNHSWQLWNSFSKDNETTPTYVKQISETTQFITIFVSGNSGEELPFVFCGFFQWEMIHPDSFQVAGASLFSWSYFAYDLSPGLTGPTQVFQIIEESKPQNYAKTQRRELMRISIGVTQWDQEHFNYLLSSEGQDRVKTQMKWLQSHGE